jgi:4-amino-4-deoxy-L-arabinose transferase-like glycosyltransferase
MNYRILSLLFVFSLLVRFLFFPYWRNLPLGGDESHYWQVACRISQGVLAPQNMFVHPPIWSYLLSLVALFSPDTIWGRIFATLLGSTIPPLVYVVGKRVFSNRVGIIAAVISALYPEFIGYSHYLWSENFYLLFSLVISYLYFEQSHTGSLESKLYLSFALMGVALLVKESGFLFFCAAVFTLKWFDIPKQRRILTRSFLLFLLPVVTYSAYASFHNNRIIVVDEAPIINANEAEYGHGVWKLSREGNRELFRSEVLERKARYVLHNIPKQCANLWTPDSFVVYRLLGATKFGNYAMPHALAFAYLTLFAYIAVVVLGLTGMALSDGSPFKTFSLHYLMLISLSGTFFLLCSRFRIPVMYIFILYAAVALSNPEKILELKTKAGSKSALALALTLALFAIVIRSKWKTLGGWG